MQKNVEIADRLGYLDIPDGLLVSSNEAKQMRDNEIVFLVTGSQGETRAALSQMATQSYKGMILMKAIQWCFRPASFPETSA